MKIAIVTNPRSRKNLRDPGRAERLREIVGDLGEVRQTESPEELRQALPELLAGGATVLVSDGGDGSLHWMLNTLSELEREGELTAPAPPVVPTNGGTIDFVARKAGIRGDATKIVRRLVDAVQQGRELPCQDLDSLAIDMSVRDEDGQEHRSRRVGFALAAGGVGQRFFDKYYAQDELGSGAIVRVIVRACASQAARALRLPVAAETLQYGEEVFRPTHARVRIDGVAVEAEHHGALHAGAFDVDLGGVVRVFPLARPPGTLHFQAGDISTWGIIKNIPKLVVGKSLDHDKLHEVAGEQMQIEALGDEALAPVIDGELYANVTQITVSQGPAVRLLTVRR